MYTQSELDDKMYAPATTSCSDLLGYPSVYFLKTSIKKKERNRNPPLQSQLQSYIIASDGDHEDDRKNDWSLSRILTFPQQQKMWNVRNNIILSYEMMLTFVEKTLLERKEFRRWMVDDVRWGTRDEESKTEREQEIRDIIPYIKREEEHPQSEPEENQRSKSRRTSWKKEKIL